MGKKYIIELPENTHWIQWVMEGTKDHHPYMDFKQVEDLTPYTEPDLEQVREEAYENGYESGFVDGHLKAEKSGQSFYEDGYQCGLNDAWEAARTLWNTAKRKEIFGYTVFSTALMTLTGQEAIEKIRQYEQRQEEQIQVGDEVITASGKAVVLGVGPVHFEYVNADGSNGFDKVKNVEKTGRHFPEIVEVLRKMNESE